MGAFLGSQLVAVDDGLFSDGISLHKTLLGRLHHLLSPFFTIV